VKEKHLDSPAVNGLQWICQFTVTLHIL